jgi:hypothetical protein
MKRQLTKDERRAYAALARWYRRLQEAKAAADAQAAREHREGRSGASAAAQKRAVPA